ncbi:DsbA family oxidoreductase [Microvirga subterranea]|uniref:Putative DsbA family dithiol-disulfide isomerase n=1 Tax=Microvirga subterranea TaxID=186651 RepID=A0A370HVH9_9HYPH|nr:DsbA family oxidoreductase [Microvirga subterranea]RDI62517.1 putative DsbA family dithiol-disulfide isomerase [Microvirga subterranea]
MPKDTAIQISVWSDYVCPFCYLEVPVLDQIRRELGDEVAIDWRAFELRPDPVPTLDPNAEYLHRVWNQSVYPMAKERGLSLSLPPVQPRSRKAHEAAEFAREAGLLDEMNRALFRAFFEEGRDLADLDVLLDVGELAGLERGDLREALEKNRYTQKVLEDEHLAQQIGITGVPALVIGGGRHAYLLSGAQPVETVREVIAKATREAAS